jgi:hypothetical protein
LHPRNVDELSGDSLEGIVMHTILSYLAALAASTLFAASASAQSITDIRGRAQVYDKFFFPSGVPANYLDTSTTVKPPKTRAFKTVIPGLLYRGGGAGGKVPLSQEALKGLCEAGFSLTVYGYTEGFRGTQQIQCTNTISGEQNTLTYIAGEASKLAFEQDVMNRIQTVVANPNAGPVFVHCWNGDHASGELASFALRQFCGWSGPAATAYWSRNQHGAAPISRIGKFNPNPALGIAEEDRAVLCRQQR